MKQQDAVAALQTPKKKTRFVVEFSEEQVNWLNLMERKTGLSRDMLVFAGLNALKENPNGHLKLAIEEQSKRALSFLETMS